MKVVVIPNDWKSPARIEYSTDAADIREAVQQFGRTSDTVELYDDGGDLIAVAAWPSGWSNYKYCSRPNGNPRDWIWQ